jgi:hypothetical protein
MKNNKGFAITATIYGFLVLFLIILLSVLAVLRSENNRSITISESIDNNTFLYNEEVYAEIVRIGNGNYTEKNTRGKYYLRFKYNADSGNSNIEDCYVYLPNNSKISVDGGVLKINDTTASVFGTACNNSNISEVYIIERYVAKNTD